MSNIITATCHTCGHKWEVDLAKAQAERAIFKGGKKIRVETYFFTCPNDSTKVAVEVGREA